MANDRPGSGQTALVTGASSGIGVDLATCFAALWEEARDTGLRVSCLCPGPTASKFRERAGTGRTRLAKASPVMPSMPVAEQGYQGWRSNERVVVTGARNRILAQVAPVMPRGLILRIVRQLQSPTREA